MGWKNISHYFIFREIKIIGISEQKHSETSFEGKDNFYQDELCQSVHRSFEAVRRIQRENSIQAQDRGWLPIVCAVDWCDSVRILLSGWHFPIQLFPVWLHIMCGHFCAGCVLACSDQPKESQ